MKGITRLTISLYIVVICLIILNLFFSPDGLIAYAELEDYKDTIEQNIEELNIINSNLVLDSEKLIKRSDEIKLQARELGWVEGDEGIIVVRGYEKSKPGYSIGRLLSRELKSIDKHYNNLIIALLIGLSFYILTGFFREQKN